MVGADVPGGPSPARNAAGRPTTEPRAGVGCRRARGTRAPTNVGVLIRQGQPTWETRADTPRRGRLGDFARRAVGGRLWIWPWVGCWSTAAQGPAATSAALPCGRGCRGRGISRRNSSAGAIRGAAAREVPAPPSARDVQAGPAQGPAQGPAATSAAIPCRRGCRGRAISPRNSSEVKSRITKPTAGAWPDYVAHKKRGKSGRGGAIGICGRADVPGGPTPARNAVGRLTAWARAGARDARPCPCRGHSIVRHARAIVRHIGAIVRQSQPTWEIRADVPRRGWRGYIARRGSVHVREL